MIETHLPVLQIVVPLVAAPICLLLRQRHLVWAFSVLVSACTMVIAAQLLTAVLEHGALSYAVGGWSPPWGIELRIDVVNAFVLLLVGLIATIVLLYAPSSVGAEIAKRHQTLFYTAYLLCLTGLLGIAATGDAFNLFVFLEISSLSSYALISMGKDRRALTAAYQYLVTGTIGAPFILIGVGLMYMMTGTLNMADLATRLQMAPASGSRTVLVAFAFFSVGVFLKLALFPLHLWLPNAYAYAPSVVSAFIAATATKVSIYVFLRFAFTIFGVDFSFATMRVDQVLMPLAVVGIFVASTVAIFQTNIKRMLAYSSVAQVGYMMLGISLLSLNGLTAGIVHLFNHALMKGGLFLAMGCIALRIGSVELKDLQGLGKRMPVTMTAFVLGGLSLIGVPLTVGFISKWYLIQAALEKGWWPLAFLLLLSSLLAAVYVWRVVEVAYFQPVPEGKDTVTEAPFTMQIPMWLLIGATLVLGIFTSQTAGVAKHAARWLLGNGA